MENSVAAKKPELVKEWSVRNYPLTPDNVSYGSSVKILWHGKCGHEWTATPKSRIVGGAGCPYCAHRRILKGFNDFASQRPETAKEWDYEKNAPLTPDQVSTFSNRRVWWKGRCGHEWYALISSRADGHGCPYCNDKKVLKGFNDFATLHPELAAEWSEKNELRPDEIPEKKQGRFLWICPECGGEYRAWISSRLSGSRCPYCSDQELKPGVNDLLSQSPEIAAEWNAEKNHDIYPSEVRKTSKSVYWWKGRCGHEWKAKVFDRTVRKEGCPVCEAEFLEALPVLLMIIYAARYGMKVSLDSDQPIGVPLNVVIPELKTAAEPEARTDYQKKIQTVKEHLCRSEGISYFRLKDTAVPVEIAADVREIFASKHIYIRTPPAEDIRLAREKYKALRERNRHEKS